MTRFVREDTEADRQAKLDAKREDLWGNHPELVIEEAGGAQWLLEQYMNNMDNGWLKWRLEAAAERLVMKGDL